MILKKIKEFIFGKDELNDNIKSILKDKKNTNEEKCDKIIKEYFHYFSNKFLQEINFSTYELYYEEFMQNEIKNEYIYNKCFIQEFENLLFYHIVTSSITIQNLFNKGFNKDKLKNKEYVDDLMDLYEEYFKSDFDGREFYSNINYRENLTTDLIVFLKKYYKNVFSVYREKTAGPFPEFENNF